ncbi:MAG: undecaprenyl-diphosphate phosphatase [Proteobacteria bacterium]|nr:undecaprenyl-diphosphate phosphatase [Pseudomonadota bacterium]MBU1711184.1 undecaprenyl-diphosphate phosphatase [Pseudomonadota bacterium]
MNLLYSIFMGILQGATEFLPISSSGHLVLAQILLDIEEAGLAFDVTLHMGTLLAIFVYFRKDFYLMIRAVLCFRDKSPEMKELRQMAFFICVATVPAVIAAMLLGDIAETAFRQSWIVAITLAAGGALLLWAEKRGAHNRDFRTITLSDALFIGCAQAFAIIPGVSRSGITMTAGLFTGLNRQAVARFSFLLSAPIILGAGVYKIPGIIKEGLAPGMMNFYLIGFLASAVSGYIFIAVLLRYIRTRTFDIFAYYRFFLAGIILLALALGW